MIRFYDKEIFCVEYDSLSRSELRSFFLKGNQAEIVCVLNNGSYEGYITWSALLSNDDIYESIEKGYVILDDMIWENGRHYFDRRTSALGEIVQLPILNKERQLVCFAYQDEEADRELRMLRELKECKNAVTFCDLNPDYEIVTIHGFNEIAYYMAGYFADLGIKVNVEGELWDEFGSWEKHVAMEYKNYEIWAEGVWQKSEDVYCERLRSVSPEFECVDKIYEANIKAGNIKDAEGNWSLLLEKLKNEKEIVVIGTDSKSQDAYDWLLENGIDVCAFLTKDRMDKGRRIFGRPVLEKTEILKKFSDPILIECHSQYSAWGFGEVDSYDCNGYRRNQEYFLLKDYVETEGSNLRHVLQEKNILLVGDPALCCRVWKWLEQCQMNTGKIRYWDILEENGAEIKKLGIQSIQGSEAEEFDLVMLVIPEYDSDYYILERTVEKRGEYIRKLNEREIFDYTDYFSVTSQLACMEIKEEKKIREELRPGGILLGAIPWYSGNILMRQSLAGHPQIMLIEEYGFFNDNLYSLCVRLAEKRSEDILSDFWRMYREEAKEGLWKRELPDQEKFDRKMEELLRFGEYFTSQELFVMFHIAYGAMYGKEIKNLKEMIIYWEPHLWDRNILKRWSYWLGSSGLKGFVLNTVRNRYVRIGSAIDAWVGKDSLWERMMMREIPEKKTVYESWEECTIKFEDIKKEPRKILTALCEWMHIAFDESLMRTTVHGEEAFYKKITGFDLKPVYNLYEEYLNSFDRMRICLLHSIFQKRNGYPFINVLSFSRRELQEMFLKEFYWERRPETVTAKDERSVWDVQKRIRKRLWQIRYNEVMNREEIFPLF